MITLYSYYRSSASFRVRIVLNQKQLAFKTAAVHLVNNGGEQHAPDYLAKNPSGLVPCLDYDGQILTQSAAICDYLNERHPLPALYPDEVFSRAWVRSVCNLVACDIHPVNNLRVLNYVTKTLNHDDAQKKEWYQHWITEGFDALEKLVAQHAGKHCFGDTVTMADAFVIPQIWNAIRFQCAMDKYPVLRRIYENAMQLAEFQNAAPAAQPDAE